MFCGGNISVSAEEGNYILLDGKTPTVIWVNESKDHCSCHLCPSTAWRESMSVTFSENVWIYLPSWQSCEYISVLRQLKGK